MRKLTLCVVMLAVASLSRADDWKSIGRKDGIEIYRREVPGTGVVAFKGLGAIDAPLWKVASILLDTKRAPEWADSLVESRVVKRLGMNVYVEYNHIHMPFILKDRDFASRVTIKIDPDARTFALEYTPTDGAVPPTKSVRGEIRFGVFEVTALDSGHSRLEAEVQCDPKGSIPAWVVNFFQKSWPVTTFENLRAQAQKPDIAMPEEFKDVLSPTAQF
jgi:hypothetical protein